MGKYKYFTEWNIILLNSILFSHIDSYSKIQLWLWNTDFILKKLVLFSIMNFIKFDQKFSSHKINFISENWFLKIFFFWPNKMKELFRMQWCFKFVSYKKFFSILPIFVSDSLHNFLLKFTFSILPEESKIDSKYPKNTLFFNFARIFENRQTKLKKTDFQQRR